MKHYKKEKLVNDNNNGDEGSHEMNQSHSESHAHYKSHTHSRTQDNALRKLIYVSLICLFFMCIEIIGGYLANSIAIMSDAAHLLSDDGHEGDHDYGNVHNFYLSF